MTLSKAIQARAERTKHVYPSDRYSLAHRALSGDRDADFKWTRLVAKRADKQGQWISDRCFMETQPRKYTWWERNSLGVCFIASGFGIAACFFGFLMLVFG